jgi:hypothetical protein
LQVVDDLLKNTNNMQEEEGDVEDEDNAVVQRLPADSNLIRPNIIDSQFNCEEREPGFYADVENECQVCDE